MFVCICTQGARESHEEDVGANVIWCGIHTYTHILCMMTDITDNKHRDADRSKYKHRDADRSKYKHRDADRCLDITDNKHLSASL
jgi:hypothetical protein